MCPKDAAPCGAMIFLSLFFLNAIYKDNFKSPARITALTPFLMVSFYAQGQVLRPTAHRTRRLLLSLLCPSLIRR